MLVYKIYFCYTFSTRSLQTIKLHPENWDIPYTEFIIREIIATPSSSLSHVLSPLLLLARSSSLSTDTKELCRPSSERSRVTLHVNRHGTCLASVRSIVNCIMTSPLEENEELPSEKKRRKRSGKGRSFAKCIVPYSKEAPGYFLSLSPSLFLHHSLVGFLLNAMKPSRSPSPPEYPRLPLSLPLSLYLPRRRWRGRPRRGRSRGGGTWRTAACLPACPLPGERQCQSVLRYWPNGRPSGSDQPEQSIYTYLPLSLSLCSSFVLSILSFPLSSLGLFPRRTCPRSPGIATLSSRCSAWVTGRSSSIPPSRRRSPLTLRIRSRVSAGQFPVCLASV